MTVAACGSTPPDYSSVWSTPATSTTTAAAPTTSAAPQPIAEYLYGVGVMGEQVPLDKLTDITVTLPPPPGWVRYPNSNYSPGTEVIAKKDTDSVATVVVLKLSGNFDVGQALKHASADAEKSKNFTKLNTSSDDFDGFPSSMIEGSYDVNGKRLHSYSRTVIPVTPAPAFQRYLVTFTVTTPADQTVTQSADVEAIIKGFTVKLK
jgi:hypothetical protein